MIENTNEHKSLEKLLLTAMVTGGDSLIENQEAAGQCQLIHSDKLPSDVNAKGRAELEGVGFTFGDPDPSDPLFMSAALPAGWVRKATDHAMWSHLLDEFGRRRVSIFYKAAFYDRAAYMDVVSLAAYVRTQILQGQPVVTDGTWATPEGVAAALEKIVEESAGEAEEWASCLPDSESAKRHSAEYERFAAALDAMKKG